MGFAAFAYSCAPVLPQCSVMEPKSLHCRDNSKDTNTSMEIILWWNQEDTMVLSNICVSVLKWRELQTHKPIFISQWKISISI